jgi:hypothetical protein
MMLTDGVLLMQHSNSDQGILLINPSLQKLLSPETEDKTPLRGAEITASNLPQSNVSPKSIQDLGIGRSSFKLSSLQQIRTENNLGPKKSA